MKMTWLAAGLLIAAALLVSSGHGATMRNPECYVKNPPKQVQFSLGYKPKEYAGGSVIGIIQGRCNPPRGRIAAQGVFACLQRDFRTVQCVANQRHYELSVNAVALHQCQYTTFFYRWTVEGYAWVTYLDGSHYTSLTETSVPIEYPCH